ncbi:hypothetical protein AMECASPLE_028175, partial [Ameca splendens]
SVEDYGFRRTKSTSYIKGDCEQQTTYPAQQLPYGARQQPGNASLALGLFSLKPPAPYLHWGDLCLPPTEVSPLGFKFNPRQKQFGCVLF